VREVALWAAVGVLGGLGALARFLVDGAVTRRAGGRFPVGTGVVNVSGSLVLGLLSGLAVDGDAGLLAGTAVVGSYTTFSTWMFETHRLAEDGRSAAAALDVGGSLALGLAAVALGRWLGGA
jgi:fluoride exporter